MLSIKFYSKAQSRLFQTPLLYRPNVCFSSQKQTLRGHATDKDTENENENEHTKKK